MTIIKSIQLRRLPNVKQVSLVQKYYFMTWTENLHAYKVGFARTVIWSLFFIRIIEASNK